ncbi:MAG TPA: tetratricopeptide repeat protein, partial [bacterium]|nr:tetratricopeptide repeat protein [bacterium]
TLITYQQIKEASAIVIEITKTNYEPMIKQIFRPYQNTYNITLTKAKTLPETKPPPEPQKQEKPFSQYLEELINSIPLPPEDPQQQIEQQIQTNQTALQEIKPQIPDIPQITIKPVDLSGLSLPTTTIQPVTINTPEINTITRGEPPQTPFLPGQIQNTGTPIAIDKPEIKITPVDLTNLQTQEISIPTNKEPEELFYGKLYRKLNDYNQAEQYLKKAIEKYQNTETTYEAMKELLLLYFDWKKPDQLEQTLQQIEETYPEQKQDQKKYCYFMAGEYFYYQHDYAKAIQHWEKIIEDGTDIFGGETYFVLAHSHELSENTETAIKYYQTVIERYPKTYYAYRVPWILGQIYKRKGDTQMDKSSYEKSIYWFTKAKQLYPDENTSTKSFFFAGLVYLYDIKDYEKARQIFEQYLEQYPKGDDVIGAKYCLVYCYKETGEQEKALSFAEEIITKYPDTPEADQLKKNQIKEKQGEKQ